MTNVVSVRFRGGCKTYYFDPRELTVSEGDYVVVETAQGLEYALCAEGNHEVNESEVVQPLRAVARLATENDKRTVSYNRQREKEAFAICQKKILSHGLDMKLVRVECSFEGNKILFFFTSENRVDFRELVKDLAGVFRARIELRQIGVRDEAKMLGGLGICGRPFCCNSFLDDFIPVSIKMAKTQNLSLNPTKISGTCGRLMCCLKYEQNAYEDAVKRMPKSDSFVQTPDGVGNVSNLDILRERVTVRLDTQPEAPKCYHNCEICVLRNGKGSREGVQIPEKRPERFVEAKEPEEDPLLTAFSDLTFDAPAASAATGIRTERTQPAAKPESGEDKPHRRRSRGGRGRRKPEGAREGGAPERARTAPAPAPKPVQQGNADQPRAAAGAPARRRHRGGRRHGGKGPAPQGGSES